MHDVLASPTVIVRVDGSPAAANAAAWAIQLFVSGIRDRHRLGGTGDTGSCSVLTVGGGRSW